MASMNGDPRTNAIFESIIAAFAEQGLIITSQEEEIVWPEFPDYVVMSLGYGITRILRDKGINVDSLGAAFNVIRDTTPVMAVRELVSQISRLAGEDDSPIDPKKTRWR